MENDIAYKVLQEILDDPNVFENNIDKLTFRDFISEKSIEAIENNIVFFNQIPPNEIKSILEEFLEILYDYEQQMMAYKTDPEIFIKSLLKPKEDISDDISLLKFSSKIKKKLSVKPSIQINQDIALIKKYLSMLERLFPLQACNPPRLYTNEFDYKISDIYDTNMALLKDLETKSFEKINKRRYYTVEKPTKNEIKLFLDSVQKKYNLKNVSLDKKQLIDSLNSI